MLSFFWGSQKDKLALAMEKNIWSDQRGGWWAVVGS